MAPRQLISGSKAEELEYPITLTVFTKCPEKWKLIDLETGEEYVGILPSNRNKHKHWKKIK